MNGQLDRIANNYSRLPVLALCGPTRAGKDTAADWLADHTSLRHPGALSTFLRPYVARREGISEDEAWARRHTDPNIWFHAGIEYVRDEPTRLIREALQHGELIVGCRHGGSLRAAIDLGLVDLAIWIDRATENGSSANRGAANGDITLTFTRGDCHIAIENNGTYDDFYARLAALLRFARIPVLVPPAIRGTTDETPN